MSEMYKVLNNDGSAIYGQGVWHLPKGKRPGKWMPRVSPVVPCESGYHLCTRDNLIEWLDPVIWVAEGRGASVVEKDKTVYEQARLLRRLETWTERSARLFACDCAEAALRLVGNPDPRSVRAIEVAWRFAVGEASVDALDAARDAAWSASAAAWSASAAARVAARSASAAASAAAWSASVAASAAARVAARAAARDAAREKQTALLWWYLDGETGPKPEVVL